MRAVVCVSRVVDAPQARALPGRSGGSGAEPGEPRSALNPADACALEEALRVRDAAPGSEVFALALGPPDCEPALRETLALGVDGALRVWDEACRDGDTLATARVLARAIHAIDADLVLCGQRSGDGGTGQMGPQLAAMLDVAGVGSVLRVEVGPDRVASAERRLDGGRRSAIRCPLPALFVVEAGANRPRYPRLRDRLRSSSAPVAVMSLADAGIDPSEAGRCGSKVSVLSLSKPKPTRKGIFVPDQDLSPEQQWEQLISGGLPAPAAAGRGPERSLEEQIAEAVQFVVERKYC
jgi:electron transfer flavoprotein beta subunit